MAAGAATFGLARASTVSSMPHPGPGRSSSGKRVGWRGLETKLDVRSLACEPEAGHVARPDRVRSASSRTIVDVAEARLAPEQVGRAAQQAIDTTLCHL